MLFVLANQVDQVQLFNPPRTYQSLTKKYIFVSEEERCVFLFMLYQNVSYRIV